MTRAGRDGRTAGPEHHRVAAVLVAGGTGSGYLLTSRLVLTAAHVVEGVHRARVTAVRGAGARTCEVVWRRHDGECDAALLVSSHPLVPPDAAAGMAPVTWARLVDEAPVRCQAMGFPRAGRGQGRALDVEHVECALRPGSGIVRGRYVLDVKDASPELADGRSPWEGMSGAALFASGGLLGVVAEAPRDWHHRRLEAIKSRFLLDDPSFTEAVTRHAGAAPAVVDVPAVPRPRKPLVLAGVPHATRRDLAVTIRANWTAARRRFFGDTSGARPFPVHPDLLDWLNQFDAPASDGVGGLRELIDDWLTDPGPDPDLKLLRLLCRLDPGGEPVWRGAAIDVETLVEGCLTGRLEDEGPARELYDALCRGGLLDALAGFTRLRSLLGVQRAWDEAWRSWLELVARIPGLPEEVRRWAVTGARGLLLVTFLPALPAGARLAAAGERATEPEPGAVGWYDALRSACGAPDTPFGRVVRLDFSGYAAAEARWRESREREAGEAARKAEDSRTHQALRHAREVRDREWAAYETRRLSPAARLAAAGRAVVWLGTCGAVLAGTAWLVWGWYRADIAWRVSSQTGLLVLMAVFERAVRAAGLGAAYQPPAGRFLRWVREEGVLAGLRRAGLVLGAVVGAGVIAHSYFGWIVGTLLAFSGMFVAMLGGHLSDWDDEHRGRLEEYESMRSDSRWREIAQGTRSSSARVRADAYTAALRQFGGLGRGGDGGGDGTGAGSARQGR